MFRPLVKLGFLGLGHYPFWHLHRPPVYPAGCGANPRPTDILEEGDNGRGADCGGE